MGPAIINNVQSLIPICEMARPGNYDAGSVSTRRLVLITVRLCGAGGVETHLLNL
jgi:hypothetical protein